MLVAALYLLCYSVFTYNSKLLGGEVGAVTALPASVIACGVAWTVALAAWSAAVRLTRHLPPHLRCTDPLPLLFNSLRSTDAYSAAALSAVVMLASTAAYGLPGVSLLLPLLLMKGGVLLAGPTVDWLQGEGVSRRARAVMCLAVVAVACALWSKVKLAAGVGADASAVCALLYVIAYFPKLKIMSRWRGAGGTTEERKRALGFQLAEMSLALVVALPASLLLDYSFRLRAAGWHGGWAAVSATLAAVPAVLRHHHLWLLSTASEGCALFGGLIFLRKSESTLSVSLNRAASALGGLVATVALWLASGGTLLRFVYGSGHGVELIGAAAMIAALWWGLRGSVAVKRREDCEEVLTSTSTCPASA